MSTIKEFYADDEHGLSPLNQSPREAANITASMTYPAESVVDIGCGHGALLTYLHNLRPDLILSGVDISQRCIDKLPKEISGKCLDFSQEQSDLPFEKYDMAVTVSTLEHIYDTDTFLGNINKVLKSNGRLIVAVPNLASLYNRVMLLFGCMPIFMEVSLKKNYGHILGMFKDEVPAGHIRMFTQKALIELLNDNGFQIVCVRGLGLDIETHRHGKLLARLYNAAVGFFTSLSSTLLIVARKKG